MEHQYMAIDRSKCFSIIKIVAVMIYLAYSAIYNSKFNVYLPINPSKKDLGIQKENLPQKVSYALIGGSNVQNGLSAETISTDSNICINYGIDNEYGGNNKYFKWLDDMVTADVVVYSPIIIWSEGQKILENDQLSKESYFPKYSIVSQLYDFYTPSKSLYTKFGDQTEYICSQGFFGHKINTQNFISSNDFIVKEIIKRVIKLKEITNTDKVLIRVPPIYTSEKNNYVFKNIIKKRLSLIKNAGIKIVGESFVSSDKTLFCDNTHPNEKGRFFFSKELKDALMGYKAGN